MTSLSRPGQPAAVRGLGHAGLALLGLALLLAMLLWQGVLRHPWPTAEDWLAPLSSTPSLEGLLLWWTQLPRAFAGVLVGACLGVSGAIMQLITRNPLVSPDLLGITAGAQLGVILGMLLPGALGLPLVFVGGLLAALFTFLMAGGWNTSPLRLTLAGVAVAQTFAALIALFLSLNDQAAMVVSLWNTGSLQQLGWGAMKPALYLLPLIALTLLMLMRPMNLAVLGDGQMRSLGLSPAWLKGLSIVLGSLLAALAIHLAGPLGFIGLITPNLLRFAFAVVRPSRLIPLCAIWGALLTVLADTLVAAVEPWFQLPLGVLSAILGSLAILLLLRYGRSAPAAAVTASMPGENRAMRLPLWSFVVLAVLICLALLVAGTAQGESGVCAFWQRVWSGEPLAMTLLDLRLPRLLVDMAAGALLATAGMLLQAVTRNPLAGPEILGVSQMAALVVLLALIFMPELAVAWRFPLAWLGAGLALVIVIGLNLRHGLEPLRVTLTGFAISGVVLAVVSLLMAQFTSNIAQALIWMVGSSYGRTWGDLQAMLPWLVIGLALCAATTRWMDLLQLGDGVAGSLGLSVPSRRVLLIVLASALIAAAVAVVGPVAFIGLLVPHGVRLLGFHRARQRLLAAPLLGATLLASADLLGRVLLAPLDIPLGIATAAIGAPLFLLLLSRVYFSDKRS
jgi:ABC-type Fe3+-siderophore transport system permease subunit